MADQPSPAPSAPPTKPTKLVQIQIYAPQPPVAERRGMLFALDDVGGIWWLDVDHGRWSLVADNLTVVQPPPFLEQGARF